MRFGRIRKSRAFIYAVAVHVVVLVVLLTRSGMKTAPTPIAPIAVPIVKARAVDQRALDAELKRRKDAEAEKQRKVNEKAAAVEKKRRAEEKRLEDVKKERARVEKEAEEKKKRLATEEKQRKAADKKKREKEKELAEKKAKATQEKKRREEEKRAVQQEKERLAEEKKKREDQKAKEEEKKRAAALREALAKEEDERAAASQRLADESEISKYIAAIRSKITGVFIYPDLEGGLTCTLYVRMIPGGEVVEARVIQSSGNASFDRQAENAVRKAAPLPVPSNTRLFQRMREIKFVFAPEH